MASPEELRALIGKAEDDAASYHEVARDEATKATGCILDLAPHLADLWEAVKHSENVGRKYAVDPDLHDEYHEAMLNVRQALKALEDAS